MSDFDKQKRDVAAMLYVASIILMLFFVLVATLTLTKCGVKPQNAPGLICRDNEVREASCPKGQSGKRFEACKAEVWSETYSDCKLYPTPPAACTKTVFDRAVLDIISTNCKGCHTTFTDYSTAKSQIDQMIYRVSSTKADVRMPRGKDPLKPEDIAKFSSWKADGLLLTCPDPGEKPNPTHLDLNYQEQAAFLDSKNIPLGQQADTRWLTTTHKSNEGEKTAVLKIFESAIQKTVNSMSRARTLFLAKAVDEFQTVFRINLSDLKLTARDWNLIENTDPLNLESRTNISLILRGMTGTRKPIMNADAFIASALTAKTYYDIKNVSNNVTGFLASLGVAQNTQLNDFEALQVGITKGTISLNKNRLLLRLNGTNGAVWRTFDTDSRLVTDNRNLSKFPLILSFGNRSFRSDASEIIAAQQNGLLVFALFDAVGNRLNEAALTVVAHNVNPPADPTVRAANTCSRCHSAGFIPRKDEIRAIVDRTAVLFPDLRDVDLVDQLYRDPTLAFANDNGEFAVALSKLGIAATDVDPISVSQDSLNERPLGLKEIAALLSLTEDEFRLALNRSSEGTQQLGQILTGGSVNIDVLKKVLPQLLKDINYGKEPIK